MNDRRRLDQNQALKCEVTGAGRVNLNVAHSLTNGMTVVYVVLLKAEKSANSNKMARQRAVKLGMSQKDGCTAQPKSVLSSTVRLAN
jgi:hypothetical protein